MGDRGVSPASLAALLTSGVALGSVVALLAVTLNKPAPPPPSPPRRRRGNYRDSEDDSDEDRRPPRVKRHIKEVVQEDETLGMCAGFSMEQAREMADAGHEAAKSKTPAEVLSELQKGNARFWTGRAQRPESSAFERRALISKQFPVTAILSCSDSRVPIEIVFDQGLGDMFVIRVAGNCLDTTTTASLQYAVHHLKVKVLIVMGHEGCGAIKAAQLPEKAIADEPASLRELLTNLKSGLNVDKLTHVMDSRAHDREAVTANVRSQVERLTKDKSVMSKVRAGELMVLGAFYEMSSGIVDFFDEVSLEEGELSPVKTQGNGNSPMRMPSRGVMSRFDTR